jgi:hypothetical protein
MQEVCMPATMTAAPRRSSTTLLDALAPIHEEWISTVHRAVSPALLGSASIWDRWTAARYLGDQFAARLEQERKLVRYVPGLEPGALARIEADFGSLERIRVRIVAAGRLRNTGGVVMLLLRSFLELLAEWCVAIELAADRVPLAELPTEAAQILSDLQPEASPGGVCW